MIGFIAAISLLLRHWGAIERYHQPAPQEDLTTPLLQVRPLSTCAHTPAEIGAAAAAAAVAVVGDVVVVLQRVIGTPTWTASVRLFEFPDGKTVVL